MAGCILAAVTYFPIFHALTQYGNPDVFTAQAKNPVTVVADPDQCSFQFDPVGKPNSPVPATSPRRCWRNGQSPTRTRKPNRVPSRKCASATKVISSFEGTGMPAADFKTRNDAFTATLGTALKDAGYPEKADPAKTNYPMVLLLLTILVIYVTMVYGPIAAWLVELFPACRYLDVAAVPHGNGWFGGFLPTVAFAMVAATRDIYYGLWYPIVIAVMTAILGTVLLPETKDREIHHT